MQRGDEKWKRPAPWFWTYQYLLFSTSGVVLIFIGVFTRNPTAFVPVPMLLGITVGIEGLKALKGVKISLEPKDEDA